MDLSELVNLINIRQYVFNAINLSSIDRATVNELNGMQFLLDKKIIEILKDTEFKNYIGYSDIKEVIANAAKITNIKSALKK